MPVLLGLAAALPARAEPTALVQREVGHLLLYIEQSGCEFSRNGVWSSGRTAHAHMQTRYASLARQDRIRDTGDFIAIAATESSAPDRPDQVRCGLAAPMASGRWLREELARYQSQKRR